MSLWLSSSLCHHKYHAVGETWFWVQLQIALYQEAWGIRTYRVPSIIFIWHLCLRTNREKRRKDRCLPYPLRISKGRRCCQDNSGFAQSSRKICSQWTEPIYSLFRCSKKAFKQAIGALYKQKIINIDPEGILLIDKDWSQKRPAVETASLFCGDGEIRTLVQTRN